MTTSKSLVIQNGTTKQIPDADTLNVGAGIDGAGASLSIGSATTTTITIGDPLGGSTTVFPGPVQLDGNVTTVAGTTFTTDAVFQGNVTFGTGTAPDETVTFNGATVSSDIAFTAPGYRVTNMLDPLSAQDGATRAYADLKLALTGGTMSGAINMGSQSITNLANGTAATDAVNLSQLSAVSDFQYDQEIFVAKNGSDVTGTGAVLNPFASITAAMAAITDASPTKRYAIRVEPGAYTEAGALNLKPNVFIIGPVANAVRVTATSFGLDASFTGAGDNRSGFSQMVLIGAATFNFATVTSSAGKLYCQSVTFNSAVTLTGFNSINQAQFDSCQFFGVFTVSGVNVGVYTNNFHFSNVVLTQAGAGLPTILNAAGGRLGGTLTATTTVNDFNRRISIFAQSFWMNGAVTIDGPSSYLDYTVDSLPSGGASNPNGGNLVSIDYGANKALSNLVYPTAVNNPIIPATTNATNMGDWDKQWFFSFAYVFTSSGTDLYIGSAGPAAVADSTGRGVYLQSDQYGLQSNVNGGVLDLRTANTTGTGISGDVAIATGTSVDGNSGDVTITTGTPSGTGTRGVISLDGAEVDVNSKKIVNVANGTNPNDAVNFSQLSAIVSGVSSVSATAPLLSSGGATPDISIDTTGASSGDVLTYNGAAWAAAAPVTTPPGGAVNDIQLNDGSGGFTGSTDLSFTSNSLYVNSQIEVTDGSPQSLVLTKNSVTSGDTTLDIEAASSVTATITGGATYLLTPNSVQTGFATSGALTFDLDPSLTPYKQVGALTGDISLANASNPGAARSITVEIIGDTVSRNVTSVPAGWTWLGGSAPTVVPANATVILSLACFGSSNNDVVASWSYDGSTAVTDVTATAPLLSSGGATPNLSIDTAGASAGDVLTYDGSAWAAAAIPAGTDYSVVTLTTAQAANTAVTVAGAAAQANSASTSRVAGIVTATNTVKVLGICTCDVEGALSIAAGDVVFLSASEAGAVTNVAPSASGEVVAELGIATAASSGGTVSVLWQPKSITVL